MLTDAQKDRLAARWLGEALREVAILVLVFAPLDWFLGPHTDITSVTLAAISASSLVFAIGMHVGLKGEAE